MSIRRLVMSIIRLRNGETMRQLVKWCLVGFVNSALDFTVYYLLTRFTEFWSVRLVLAAVASFVCGMLSSFVLNSLWTFRHDLAGWRARLPKFLLVAFGGMAWNAVILSMLLDIGVHDLVGKVITTVCVTGWNFTMQKHWTFRR